MEAADAAPELPVETEYVVRKTSVSSDSGGQIIIEKNSNTFPSLTYSVANQPPVLSEHPHPINVVSELIVESDIKRNDSYSKFGHLETINLEVAEQELQNSAAVASNSLMYAEQEKSSQNENCDKTKVEEVKESAEISLSRYFGSEPSTKEDVTNSTAKFFDVVAGSPALEHEPSDAVNVASKVEENSHPPLLRFFAEDRSGRDRTGKEFFDKIAIDTGSSFLNSISSTNLITDPAFSVAQKHDGLTSTLSSQPNAVPFLIPSPTPANEEMYEAWIPSDNTRHILITTVTSAPGTFYPDANKLTSPSIIIEEEMEDPIKLLLVEVNSPMAQQRKVLTANDVTQNEEGLKKLIDSDCYHAAINLTGRLLNNLNRTAAKDSMIKHSSYSLKLWFIRIALFVKLRKFSYAEVESEAFGDFDKPDLYYEFYPDFYCGKKGSLVPFSFRLLLAELPQYQGNHQIALNNLYRIIHVVQKIISNLESKLAEDGSMVELSDSRRKASLQLWHQREHKVLYSILNCFLSQKDYIMSVSIIRILLEKDKNHIIQLYSALGRIYLQLGDMKQAQSCFTLAGGEAKKVQDKNIEVERLINNALLSITHNENEDAYKMYEQALALQPENPMLVNNMAVCLLYMGRLKESLALLEQAIQKNPRLCLHDGILFNVCTLYELESSHCTMKKYAMLNLVSKYAGDSFMISCLKIPPNSKM